MQKQCVLILMTLCLAVPVFAQSPDGWQVRIDRSQNAQDPDDRPDIMFMAMGKGLHVASGPAGTFWHPRNAAKGDYTLKGIFNLNKPSSHTNYYGLVFGGGTLEGAGQTYIYFVVAQDGTYLIKQRSGETVTDVKARSPHDAVKRPDATGRSTNALEVRVAGDTVSYLVNGTVVHTAPKGALKTDGLAGFRVNHQLDVAVEGFELQNRS